MPPRSRSRWSFPPTSRSVRESPLTSPTARTLPSSWPGGKLVGTSGPPRCLRSNRGGPLVRETITSSRSSLFQSSTTTWCAPARAAGTPDVAVMSTKYMLPRLRQTRSRAASGVTASRSSLPVKSRSTTAPARPANPASPEARVRSRATPLVWKRKACAAVSPSTITSSKRSLLRSPTMAWKYCAPSLSGSRSPSGPNRPPALASNRKPSAPSRTKRLLRPSRL